MTAPREPVRATPEHPSGPQRVPGLLSRSAAGPSFVVATLIAFLIILSLDTETLLVIPLLGRIATEFELSAAQTSWVLSATGIAAGATVPLLTRLGDIFGLRRLLLATLTIVAIGNVICALAPNGDVFLLGRVVVGINAGLPLYYAILRAGSVSKQVMDRFVGVVTAALGGAVALSFVLGGVIIEAGGSVRLVLWTIAVLSVVVIVLVRTLIPEVPVRAHTPIDWLGALLLAVGLASVVAGISQGNRWRWTSVAALSCIVGGAAVLVGWAAWELQHEHPLIQLRTVVSRDMWPSFAIAALAGFMGTNTLLVISEYVQTPAAVGYGFGASVLRTSFYLLPAGLVIVVGGTFVAPLVERVGVRTAMFAGAGLAVALYLWFAMADWTRAALVVLSLLVGVSYSILYTAGTAGYLRSARPGEQGMITGSARSASTAVQAVGPAIITALLTAALLPKTPVPKEGNYTHVWIMFLIVALLALACAVFVREPHFDQRLARDAVEVEVEE